MGGSGDRVPACQLQLRHLVHSSGVTWSRTAAGGLGARFAAADHNKCADVGSGGSASSSTGVRFDAASPSAPTGPGQAYFNVSAPAWGASVVKLGGVHLIRGNEGI